MSVGQKNECGQENLSVLSVSVSVDCGLWTVDYDSAVSGEPLFFLTSRLQDSHQRSASFAMSSTWGSSM